MTTNAEHYRVISQHLEYHFVDSIDSFSDYHDLFNILAQASDQDIITLAINCGGGRCDVGQMIIRAIKNSKAHIIAKIVSPSASMASLIALACDDLVMEPGTYLMFHNYSSGAQGKGGAMIQQVKADDKALKAMNEICYPFLSKAEIKATDNDKDLYIHSDDKTLSERITRHYTKDRG